MKKMAVGSHTAVRLPPDVRNAKQILDNIHDEHEIKGIMASLKPQQRR